MVMNSELGLFLSNIPGLVKGSNLQGIHDSQVFRHSQNNEREPVFPCGGQATFQCPLEHPQGLYWHLQTKNHQQRKVGESGPIGKGLVKRR